MDRILTQVQIRQLILFQGLNKMCHARRGYLVFWNIKINKIPGLFQTLAQQDRSLMLEYQAINIKKHQNSGVLKKLDQSFQSFFSQSVFICVFVISES